MRARHIRRGGGAIAAEPWLAPCLAIVAILLRLAIPAGWMPAPDRFALIPCTGMVAHSARPMTHGMHHGGGQPADNGPEHPCAFAGFAAALVAPAAFGDALPLPPAAAPAMTALAATVGIGRGLAAPPPPPTGPPALR